MTWERDALCREYPAVPFFASRKGDTLEAAKIICSMCTVRQECLTFALELGLTDGIFGGHTAKERAGLVRQRAA